MRDWAGQRYWLVGASDGLGRALAERMSRCGVDLVLSARNEQKLTELAEALPGRTQVVPCDIADDASVAQAVEAVGDVDGVVFLAGVYWPHSAKTWDVDQVAAMCDVNLTGAVRVLGRVVPVFAARDRGHVVITGSLSGFRGLPGTVGYSASKAGTMVLAESLYADLRRSAVEVQLANPGFIRTRLTEKNDFSMPFLMEPEDAARVMFDFMTRGGFKRSFPSVFSWLFRGGQFLPDWVYYRLFPPAA